ncbi:hypothetical protein M2459_001363 [Parabacteroides sp. PF5-5]|uniref:hypothetical protein n=1 Tax=unclassified Parabacteroides TaxID=2649774 RepID=UPI002473DCF9|nr:MULTISPECIES: hypothetical protein [unclassified Parabacteroides]MDH6304628.1 hypothetical protein [Parabacteroides sp. PH5-39]MDH6315759.1 hypothetical protein [Parabacteroides sp. PF5-13]MDH6319418.1 hypothetical protein [Parabacteroides sp. PH5-13]MDH6323149.1 hypothetical protein [Parabacteroides sp. PH5-8]MDH6326951.1 hypothetical protein [Parabacteroides sp. PH5-41]
MRAFEKYDFDSDKEFRVKVGKGNKLEITIQDFHLIFGVRLCKKEAQNLIDFMKDKLDVLKD